MEPNESPFVYAEELITSLLLYWMHPSQPASLLLCGSSGNGKSHITDTAIARAKAQGRRAVFSVFPFIAESLAVLLADGATALRRDIRRAISRGATEQCANGSDEVAVAVVLDHAELLLSTTASGGNTVPQHPALLADLYDCIRARPLFDTAELERMRLASVVFIVLFSGPYEAVDPLARTTLFDTHVTLRTPTESERLLFFSACAPLSRALAARSGGITYRGLSEIRAAAHAATARDPTASRSSPAVLAHALLRDFSASGSAAAAAHRASAGYVDVQQTRWGDVAGLSPVKRALRALVRRPLRAAAVYRRFGVRPATGLLLHGPPGTGKTMLARAMATELSASFVYVDLPALVHAEVGESERRLREFFAVARERSPSVMFIDELQAAFAIRGRGRDECAAHEERLVGQLLHLLDDAQEDTAHFILFVGATNVVHLIDPALLRAGRLDTIIEVPLPDEAARRALIIRVVSGEWTPWLGANENARLALIELFITITKGFSGAEMENIMHIFAIHFFQLTEGSMKCFEALSELIIEASNGLLSDTAQKAVDYAVSIARENHANNDYLPFRIN